MRLDHLVRLVSQQWAIHPDVLENWCSILDAKLAGHPLPADLAASGADRSVSADEPFIRDGNVAIVPMVGTLVKANSLFTCDATYGDLRKAVAAAEQAKGIDAILLAGDTPGGTVAGVQDFSDFLSQVNQRKALYGWVDDLTASAGYWLMAQTRMIGANAASDIGSIGVLTVHYDRSGRDQQQGVQRTVLAVGDFKAAGNDTAPLSPDARAYIMDRLEQTYSLFISAVTSGRKISAEQVRGMQSRMYKATQAKEQGLIDHVMGQDEYLALIKNQVKGTVSKTFIKGENLMDLATLKKDHPELLAQIEAAARQGMIAQAEADAARIEATAAESTRILALVTAAVGEESGKRIAAAAAKGLTAEDLAALGVNLAPVAAVGATETQMLAAITAAASPGVGALAVKGTEDDARTSAVSAIAAGGSKK
jgi:signal peptide peptidase SppA